MSFWEFALNRIIRNSKIYLFHFFSGVIASMIVFSFFIYRFHPNLIKANMNSLVSLMSIAEIIIFIFSFLFILYSINTFVNVKSKEFGVLMVLGMSKKQLDILIFLQNLTICFLAVITGMILGGIFSKFFLLASQKIKITNSLHCYLPIKAIIYTVVYFCILFFIISLCIPFLLRTKQINALIREENKKDKQIKFSKIMSILSVLLLFSGYLMAFSKKFKISLMVIIITIGTFLFFSQFSIFVIEILKKRKSFYMKKVNIIWISDLEYNIRNNAIMFFLVTILSTVTFTSIVSLYAINSTVKDDIVRTCPIPFVCASLSGNNKEQQDIKSIEDSFNDGGFKLKKLLYEKINKEPKNSFFVYKLEHEKKEWRELIYVWIFIAVILFIGAGSFLYLGLYATLNQEKEKYIRISKVGLTPEEMGKAATIQIAILFFTPYIMAAIHTCFFIARLGLFQGLASKLFTVLFIFFVIQFIYFLIIRSRYIKYLSRFII
ncbi:FtsX-like permease family protein [Tepidibacter hydrothermalis]|uniref:ABC transporter permease n=1 Tax=Tepidibacter hydrothermalis TaxID=3036126 RepID=A0ABY8E9N8_9FIRM|nr:ABC transporter permease [Tepidibacter hydrothermalis]WFD08650.1 ABC transporter permease [Tepidibacter hydrothermalis]